MKKHAFFFVICDVCTMRAQVRLEYLRDELLKPFSQSQTQDINICHVLSHSVLKPKQ